MTRTRRTPSGSTLIELLVTIALLGVIASVTTLAARNYPAPNPDDPAVIISRAVDSVLTTGLPLTLTIAHDGERALATINPDGSVVADSVLHIERLTGRASGAR